MEKYRRFLIFGFVLLLILPAMWLAGRVLLLLFCGILLAVFLHSIAHAIGHRLRLPHPVSLTLALVLILALCGSAVYLLAPQVVHQAAELRQNIGATLDRLQATIAHHFPDFQLRAGTLFSGTRLTSQIFGLTSSVVGILVGVGIVLFVGIYAAADPRLYVRGFLHLFKPGWRPRAEEVLVEMGRALRWWLLGRGIAMASVGLLAVAGLWVGGVHLAFTLGLITGLLTFIPYLGAIASAVPAVLIAFTQGPGFVAYVLAIFSLAHILEGYVIVPLVQQKVIHLPPALLLAAQAILGTLFGVIGVALAAPLTAICMVATKLLYLRDVLGEPFPSEKELPPL